KSHLPAMVGRSHRLDLKGHADDCSVRMDSSGHSGMMTCLPCEWFNDTTCGTRPEPNVTIPCAPEPTAIPYYHDYLNTYVDTVCYENTLHWLATYFLFLTLFQSFILLASSVYFELPQTRSKMELFVIILLQCCNYSRTTRVVVEERDPKPPGKINGSVDKKASSISEDVEAGRIKSRIEQGIVDRSDTGF
ncbi:hypothetical protein WMY93_033403, partial [Mugilogobius chulae]